MIDYANVFHFLRGDYRVAVVAPGIRAEHLPCGRVLLHGSAWRSLLTAEESTPVGLVRTIRRRLTNPYLKVS